MKLFQITAVCDGWDNHYLVVGESEEDEKKKAYEQHEDEICYRVTVKEVNEINGYKIKLEKKGDL